MKNDQTDLTKKMFEYNLWANSQLIEICNELDDEQLATEIDGAYGRIHPTLVHLIRAEGGYLNRLTGSRPWAVEMEWDDMPMSGLLAMAQLSGNQLISIGDTVNLAIGHEVESEGRQIHFFNWTVMLQALYHGIEHRTQIKFILTKLGLAHPDLDAWDYVESLSF